MNRFVLAVGEAFVVNVGAVAEIARFVDVLIDTRRTAHCTTFDS